MGSDRLERAIAELLAAMREELRAAAHENPPPGPPRLLSVSEAARALGLARTTLYAEIGRGRLRTVRVGRRRLVPESALGEYVDVLKAESERV